MKTLYSRLVSAALLTISILTVAEASVTQAFAKGSDDGGDFWHRYWQDSENFASNAHDYGNMLNGVWTKPMNTDGSGCLVNTTGEYLDSSHGGELSVKVAYKGTWLGWVHNIDEALSSKLMRVVLLKDGNTEIGSKSVYIADLTSHTTIASNDTQSNIIANSATQQLVEFSIHSDQILGDIRIKICEIAKEARLEAYRTELKMEW